LKFESTTPIRYVWMMRFHWYRANRSFFLWEMVRTSSRFKSY